jgi:hypothetical protein
MESLDTLLAKVESLEGNYIWESETKVISFLDVQIEDETLAFLRRLSGAQQIVLNAANLSAPALRDLAALPGLKSLVLLQSRLSSEDLGELRDIGPEVKLIDEA